MCVKECSDRQARAAANTTSCYDRVTVPPLLPGQLHYSWRLNVIWVGCCNSYVGFKDVKLANKKIMSAKDFHNGFLGKVSNNELYFDSIK